MILVLLYQNVRGTAEVATRRARPGDIESAGAPMAWIVLVLSGMLEAGWALSLKASDGFTKLWPSVLFVVLLVASMGGLAWALKTLPVGVAYGVWVGIGAALTAVLAIVLFDEAVSVLKIVSLVLIIAGVVGLNLSSSAQ
jgi:quaternary ammonium compound-resistance protein SugE